MASTQETTPNMERIKKALFRNAMQGKWDEVVSIYDANEEAHMTKITKSGDTALHVAVSDDRTDIVEQLLLIIRSSMNAKEVLEIQNERGNTSLHLAALMGSVRMCKCIADPFPYLIGSRNHDNETPLFLAVLHGKKEVFLCLNQIARCDNGETYCRRKDGDTILHSAIAGEYFDLAFQIICRYHNLVHSVNEEGMSALHLLATKRSCFRSGTHFGWLAKIIHHCIFVKELKEETFNMNKDLVESFGEEMAPPFPPNYKLCTNLLALPWLAFTRLWNTGRDPERTGEQADLEYSDGNQPIMKGERLQGLPSNYYTCFGIIQVVSKAILVILRTGIGKIRKIQEIKEIKEKHIWTAQIMHELLCHVSIYEHQEDSGDIPEQSSLRMDDYEIEPYSIIDGDDTYDKEAIFGSQSLLEGKKKMLAGKTKKQETPILIATKNGISEMVKGILELFPVAIYDVDHQKKNIVLLAVEHRQPHIYLKLLRKAFFTDTAFRHVDKDGNSALHLVAKLGYSGAYPFAAVQMQWEFKWYLFVRCSLPRNYFITYNKEGKTAKEIFTESHQELASKEGEWLNSISNSCSVVATLVAGVSFATTATVPGGIKEDSSKPTFERHQAFLIYAVSSLIALVFSVTSMVSFLAILTARRKMEDFELGLPRKLLLALTCLFISIGAMLVCFCSANFFLLKDVLEDNAFTVYTLACLPTTILMIFTIAQFPFYFDLLWSTFKRVPQRHFT